ncbi:MAG: acyl transferase [Chitinophagales bacterium]
MPNQWFHKIFSVDDTGFEQLALELFRFQYKDNLVYKAYTDMLKVDPKKVNTLAEIPFLPIRFFKTHAIKTTEFEAGIVFESSGTTQAANSHHFVKDTAWYRQSFLKAFELFYGPVNQWCIIGLLPSYLERKNSSLVFMAEELIHRSEHLQSGFYLYDHTKLFETLTELEINKQKTLLLGVSFALLDFAEKYSLKLENTIVMETGGMKGRKEELVRTELHEILKKSFHLSVIHSEYGMTELLSQAYSQENGIFQCPPWMKILIRDEEDPLSIQSAVQSSESAPLTTHHSSLIAKGAINIIDLANIYSCSFIATDDAGKLYNDGNFEVLGRIDNSDVRGCSLMIM